jgi:sulfite exporter TauE/SafE
VHHHADLPMGGDLALLFAASVLGSAHCLAMCGPYVAMCTAQFAPRGATPAARCGLRVLFNLGRIASYSLIGLLVGAFGQIAQAAASRFGLTGIIAIAAGGAALVFGLSMIGWFSDPARVVTMAGMGRWLIAGRMHLNQAPPAAAPVLLGALQGWLPCALVYAAASRASLAGTPLMGAFTMLVFGLGTLPAVFALTLVPQRLLRRVRTQRLAGVLLAGLGVVLILRGLANLGLVAPTGWW